MATTTMLSRNHGVRLSLRVRLMFASGVLCLLLALVASATLARVARLSSMADQAVNVDGQMSNLARDIALQTLLCRRYEKDFLLRVGDADEQSLSRRRWQQSTEELREAIDAFAAKATSLDDRRQVVVWRGAYDQYISAFTQIQRGVDSGRINTPQQAIREFEPYQNNIGTLTDLSIKIARAKANQAQQAGDQLAAVSGAAIWQGALAGLLALLLAVGWSLWFPARLLQPISSLHAAVVRMSRGDLSVRVDEHRSDELGVLAGTFNQMANSLQRSTADLSAQYAAAEAARAAAEEARAQIAEQLATIESQREIIREMSVPTLPLSEHTLVMPLVGALDTARLAMVRDRALQTIQQQRVRFLILDITGVPVVDTLVAQGLLQVVHAARLLGTQVVLVGIRPEVAQAVVGLGFDLGSVVTCSSLQSGLRYATQGQGARG